MKKIYSFFFAVLVSISCFAQTPQKMSYQAVIRDADNHPVITQVGMRISILQGAVDGSAVYTETQTPTPNINGLVTIEIGTGTTTDDFSAINWSTGTYFIKTETDPAGGTNYTAIVGTSQLLSVPYALHANTAASYTETDPSVPTGTNPGQMQYWNGTAWVMVSTGTTGQLLAVNATGVPEWQNPSSLKSAGTNMPTINATGVIFNGVVNANGLSTTVAFEYGTTTSYGNTVAASQSPVSEITNTAVTSTLITGLTLGAVYHVRIITQNIFGTFYGNDFTFINLYFGAAYLGGLVVTFDNSGHGLVCTSTDQGELDWETAIVTCFTLVINGFADWYLPGRYELNLMYQNLKVNNLGGFANNYYWSSTGVFASTAWYQLFINGDQDFGERLATRYVRAVRAF